jgi:reprolysin-like metallo-peptidase family M12B/putative Ig domain-containing protein
MTCPIRAAVTAVFLLSWSLPLFPQTAPSSAARSAAGIWSDVSESSIVANISSVTHGNPPRRDIVPRKYRTVQLNKSVLKNLLALARPETSGPIETTGVEIQIPLPGGGVQRFLIQDSPIMEPKLAARYPDIKTYVGQGVDDPSTTMRIDFTPRGFHAIILSPAGQVYIDPYSRDTDTHYISYFKRDFLATNKPFSCGVDSQTAAAEALAPSSVASRPTGGTLRTYRLALACTGEYAAAVCTPNAPTVSATLAAMITSVNRCSAIYERELAIRFILVSNNDRIIYLDGSSDPYTNGSGSTMLSQNQSNIDSVIGSANYDFGHVFSTGGGGIAYLGIICINGSKAKGVTGTANPIGDPYDVDYVVHEMGHQFGANHPFAGTGGSCSGNQNLASAYEPGSGTTIMAYAGICSPQDLASHSDDYFHTINYDEIDGYTSGTGSSCAQLSSTGNTPPAIAPLSGYTIPAQTPFSLTASASDPDGDTVTYCWEEFDKGPIQDPTAEPRDNGSSPLFRSFPPTTNPTRIFPSLTYILNNQNVPPATVNTLATGEYLPTTSRNMVFRVTVRDNHPGGGGSNYSSSTVSAVNSAGPFVITAPNSGATIAGGTPQTVTWNVANTNVSPINCANVKISLSTDGGNTFPIVLASSMPNIGIALVTIPNTANVATTQGRIKVEAVGNIFFDISDANLTITSTNTAPTLNISSGISVVRGKLTPTVAAVGTASDAQGDPVTVSVSDVPFGAHVTPSIFNGTISLSATVDCAVVTTLTSRTYPITITVTDSNGSTTSGKVNLMVTPNFSPTLGVYPDITLARNSSATSSPAAGVADTNGNLLANPYSVTPSILPGGGTVTVNQSTGVVTTTTTSGTTLGTLSVRVTAVDSCGASAVRIFNANLVASVTPLLQAGTASAPTVEGCAPANGAVDPGETVTVNFPINNTGAGTTSNLVASLQTSGGVTPITTSQNYGAMASGDSVSQPFQFTASGFCGGTVTATLQLQDGPTNYGTISYTIRLGTLLTTFSQNFDGVTPPALPAGWTAVVASGSMAPWATNTTTPDTAPNSISANTVASVSDNRLTSPVVSVPASGPQLSFQHRWNLEDGFDGGILEISISGGPFTEIIAAGGSFVSGPYNGSIDTGFMSPISGSNAWTGNMNANYTTTVINLPAAAAGHNAQFRWRLASDSSVSANPSTWRVDSIVLTSDAYTCTSCSSAPAITNGPPPWQVVVGAPYSFSFKATGNPAPNFVVKSGTLPPGLSLSPNGVLSGTPPSAGSSNYPSIVVGADNGNPPDAEQTFSLTAVTRAPNYLSNYGLTGTNAALLYDYDGDGIPNVTEYALGLNPTVASLSGLPVVTIKNYGGTNYLSMIFHRSAAATDLTYIVQASSDLAVWTDLASSVAGGAMSGSGFVTQTGSAPNFTDEVRDTVPVNSAPGARRFLRLKVSSP